jgi:hypothetical protein
MSVTVNYPDEGSVTYANERQRELFETLRQQWGLSVRLITHLVRAEILAQIDPIEPTGELFVFEKQRERTHTFGDRPEDCDFYWFNTELPEPYANVDLIFAFGEFRKDVGRIQRLLDPEWVISGRTSTEKLDQISKSLLGWFKFLAVRHPNAARRKRFGECVQDVEEAIEEWKKRRADTGKVLPFERPRKGENENEDEI